MGRRRVVGVPSRAASKGWTVEDVSSRYVMIKKADFFPPHNSCCTDMCFVLLYISSSDDDVAKKKVHR